MPGHIGTSIAINTGKILGGERTEEDWEMVKQNMIKLGAPVHNQSIDQIKQMIQERTDSFAKTAPTSSSEAAKVILDGVKENRWRILIGDDAKAIDEMVRRDPEEAYNIMFNGEKREWDVYCLLYTSPSPRDATLSRMPSSA